MSASEINRDVHSHVYVLHNAKKLPLYMAGTGPSGQRGASDIVTAASFNLNI